MTVTLKLSPQAESRIRELAARAGKSVEGYLEELVESTAVGTTGTPPLAPGEFRRKLLELSEGLPPLPTLPADFSRADIYADHD
jgi:hypothetical protein